MSIVCTEVKDSELVRKAAYNGTSKFVHATIDPSSVHNLSFPEHYKFGKCFLPRKYATLAERIHNFSVRPDDIWIVSFPKVGSTWVHNIVWLLKNNLDFSAPAVKPSDNFFEFATLFEEANGNVEFQKFIEKLDGLIDEYEKLPSPRIFKSHLHAYLLPKGLWEIKPKIIYVTRNPKDAAISYYHDVRNGIASYTPTIDEFFEVFLNGCTTFSSFHEHLLSFWQLRHLDHILFVTYEELSANQFGGVKRISDFLKCSFGDEQLQQVVDHVSFGNLRQKVAIVYDGAHQINATKPDPHFE